MFCIVKILRKSTFYMNDLTDYKIHNSSQNVTGVQNTMVHVNYFYSFRSCISLNYFEVCVLLVRGYLQGTERSH